MTASLKRQRWLILIIGAYFLLGLSYAAATPPLEASDEYKHFPVVQFIHSQGRLPVLHPQDPGPWLQEGAQPPLYYLLMAGLTAWVDTSDLPQLHEVNAHAFIGNPNQVGNKNLIIHDPAREAFPWQGSVLAIYLIRLVSLLCGVGTLLLVARLGERLFDRDVGLLAAALTAFNPMFLFVHASVNNDALAILLGHAAFLALVAIWQDVPPPGKQWRRYAALGLLLGLGLLTKLSLGGLLALSGLALAILAWRLRARSLLLLGGGLVLFFAVVLAAPWFLRNWMLYGDPTAMNVFVAVQGTRETAMTLADWRGEFGTFYRSFWGLFGGVNVPMPEPLYLLYNVAALAAGAAFALWSWRQWRQKRPLPSALWLLLAWPLLLFLLLLRWTIISPAFQGRLIFPALGALAILAAKGLLAVLFAGRRRWLPLLIGAAFLAAALLPWITIRPAYAMPRPLVNVPQEARYGPIRFLAPQGEIRLVGVDLEQGQSVTPGGDAVRLTLYWQAVTPVQRDYLSTVHLLGRELVSIGAVSRHPASGMVPTSRWQEGQIWRDVYHITVAEDAAAPSLLRLRVGLYDPVAAQDLPMVDPHGNSLSLLLVGEARLAAVPGLEPGPPPVREAAAFAEGIVLDGYGLSPQPAQPGVAVTLDLYWRATATPGGDYTVFIHLMQGQEQRQVYDAQPLAGDFPTTWWRTGDRFVDRRTLPLPPDLAPGAYELLVGLYEPLSGVRLPRQTGGDSLQITLDVIE